MKEYEVRKLNEAELWVVKDNSNIRIIRDKRWS